MSSERSVITGRKPQRFRRIVLKGRGAVEHDARPHEIAAHFRIADDPGRIGDRARIRQSLAGRLEHRQRLLDAIVLVGAGEMGHEPQCRDGRRGREPQAHARDVVRPEAQTVHPRVDLDEHFERPRELRDLEHAHLVHVVDNCRETALRQFGQLALREKALEQQDPARVVPLAQVDRHVRLDQRESVRILKRRQHPSEAMPVRVGLNHRQHLGVGGLRAHQRQVGAQRGEVDLGEERSGHVRAEESCSACRPAW